METIPVNFLSLNAETRIDTSWLREIFPTSISSTTALTLTWFKSAMVIRSVPPPTAAVGEVMT